MTPETNDYQSESTWDEHTPRRSMILSHALPRPGRSTSTAEKSPERALDDREIDDAYWVLRSARGQSLDERLDCYREHLVQRGTHPAEAAARVAAIQPFLSAVFGVDAPDRYAPELAEAFAGTERRTGGFGFRLPNGEVRLLTDRPLPANELADGVLHQGAEFVWVDSSGSARPIDIIVQEYDLDDWDDWTAVLRELDEGEVSP